MKTETVSLWNPTQCLMLLDSYGTDDESWPYLVIVQTVNAEEVTYFIIPSQAPLDASHVNQAKVCFKQFLKIFDLQDEIIPKVDVEIKDPDGIGEVAVLSTYLKENGTQELIRIKYHHVVKAENRERLLIACDEESKALKEV